MNNTPITSFNDEHRFLSNFWPAEVELDGDIYTSVEHAYQAAKTLDRVGRIVIQRASSAGVAKKLGQTLPLRPNWDTMKFDIMTMLVFDKFRHHSSLRKQLLATGERELIEGNHWGDTYWGVCRGKGTNHLGNILMAVRKHVKEL